MQAKFTVCWGSKAVYKKLSFDLFWPAIHGLLFTDLFYVDILNPLKRYLNPLF